MLPLVALFAPTLLFSMYSSLAGCVAVPPFMVEPADATATIVELLMPVDAPPAPLLVRLYYVPPFTTTPPVPVVTPALPFVVLVAEVGPAEPPVSTWLCHCE